MPCSRVRFIRSGLLPNGDAEAPYDVAGWTLPLQMGVDYDACLADRDLEKDRTTLKRVKTSIRLRAALNLEPEIDAVRKVSKPAEDAAADRSV